MTFRWRADVSPLMVVFGGIWIVSPLINIEKNVVNVGPSLAKLSGSAQDAQTRLSIHCEQIYDVRTLSIF